MKPFSAVLSNPAHPEYGVATIPFPIPDEQYSQVMERLEALEIGDALRQDCRVDELINSYPILKRLELTAVNVDELDYLAKRLDSFVSEETAQFQAMAHKLDLSGVKDFINLTFCCQQATVITDFSDLEKVGRAHYLHLQDGCATVEEMEALDGYETALLLIDSGGETVTPYGVVYDNGMKLEQLYDGRCFPDYDYGGSLLTVELAVQGRPGQESRSGWLHLPMSERQLARAWIRAGADTAYNVELKPVDSELPQQIAPILDIKAESAGSLNRMCQAIASLSEADKTKLEATFMMAGVNSVSEITEIAKNLDQFDFIPGVKTPEDYGRHMIRESGRFEYDSNLEMFYDYKKYGLQRIAREQGQFNDLGYVSYHGTLSLEELLQGDPAEQMDQGMGGMA